MNQLNYRYDIDGLRAVAVSAVVLYHAFPDFLPGGFVGVDVFFVISGFLITRIILNDLAGDRFYPSSFYIARIRRILPALTLVLAGTLLFGYFALLPDEFRQLGKHVLGAASFLSNVFLWTESGYFDEQAVTKPLLHLWSLAIEEQFYLIWPLILAVWVKSGRSALWLVAGLGVLSFFLNILLVRQYPSATFYLPFTRVWELLVGAALGGALLPPSINQSISQIASVVGAALVIFAVCMFEEGSSYPGWRALLPTVGTGLVVWAGSGTINRWLSCRSLGALGKISYPLYLWHWPILSLATIIDGHRPDPLQASALLGISVVLAVLTFNLLERPAQKAIAAKPIAAFIPVVALLAVGFLGGVIYRNDGWPGRPAIALAATAAENVGGSRWEFSDNELCIERYPSGWNLFCFQSNRGEPTIMIVGNSYANHLVPGAVAAWPNRTVLNVGTCDPARLRQDDPDCELQDLIIADSKTLELVILGSDWFHARSPSYAPALEQRIRAITDRGIRVAVIGPKLELPFHIRECLARPFRRTISKCDFEADDVVAGNADIVQSLKSAISTSPLVSYFDPMELFCEGGRCSAFKEGLPLLRDNGHLSVLGSRLLMDVFVKRIPFRE